MNNFSREDLALLDANREAAREKRRARIKEIMGDYPKKPKAYEANLPELQRLLAEEAAERAAR
jgi:hypothetical protein